MKAVCLRCGSFKNNAWKRCGECNYRPVGDGEKAQHLLLSSHFNNDKKLQQFSEHIKEGKDVDFKDKDLEMVTGVLKKKFQSRKDKNKYIIKLAGSFCLTIIIMVVYYFVQTKK